MSISNLQRNKSTSMNTNTRHKYITTHETHIHTNTHIHNTQKKQHTVLNWKLVCYKHAQWVREGGTRKAAATYLAVEQTVNEEDEGPLEAVDNGKQVCHDSCYGTKLEYAQHPGTAQDEDLGNGLECQQPVR